MKKDDERAIPSSRWTGRHRRRLSWRATACAWGSGAQRRDPLRHRCTEPVGCHRHRRCTPDKWPCLSYRPARNEPRKVSPPTLTHMKSFRHITIQFFGLRARIHRPVNTKSHRRCSGISNTFQLRIKSQLFQLFIYWFFELIYCISDLIWFCKDSTSSDGMDHAEWLIGWSYRGEEVQALAARCHHQYAALPHVHRVRDPIFLSKRIGIARK